MMDSYYRAFLIHEQGLDYDKNTIYLFGDESYIWGAGEPTYEPGVEFSMANRFIKNITMLGAKGSDEITIHLKTCGGDWHEGMAIYDAIRGCNNRIKMINHTHARSMSSLIFLAADERIMSPHSTFMFHEGTIYMGGTQKQFLTEVDEVKKSHTQMITIYTASMKRQGKFKDKSEDYISAWIKKMMDKKEEVYFSATEAVEYGFADSVSQPFAQ